MRSRSVSWLIQRTPRGRAAFTLTEVAIVTAFMTLLLGGAYSVVSYGERLFSDQMRQYTVDQAGRNACERIGVELRCAYPSTLMPLIISSSPYVSYQKVTGYQGGAPTLGPVTTLRFVLVPGETANGLDDNGDGRIDEGTLRITEGLNPPVDIQGHLLRANFNSTPTGLSFTVEAAIADRKGNVKRKTFVQAVSFRTSA